MEHDGRISKTNPATSPEPDGDPESDANYIRDLLRHSDKDRYWTTLFTPEPARLSLLALHAFAIELARIPDRINEPQLGQIRLQWWRDALNAIRPGAKPSHPVIDTLAIAIERHDLPVAKFDAMIEARSFDLNGQAMPDMAALHAYLDATTGAVFDIASHILGFSPEPDFVRAAARAYGLTSLMLSLPYDAARGRLFLPETLLATHGLHPNAILNGTDNPDLRAALRDLRGQATVALQEANRHFASLPRAGRPAFLPLALIPACLRKLAAADHNPLRDIVQLNPLLRYSMLWRAYLTGRI